MTFRMSVVAACCSRASFNCSSEDLERFNWIAGATGRLVLDELRRFAELFFRVLAALTLPPVLDDRAISAPKSQQGHLIRLDHQSERVGPARF